MDRPKAPPTLAPPVVMALREEAAGQASPRGHVQRSITQDIREEKEELREVAEHSRNIILDLGLDGIVRWVSSSWDEIVGTPAKSVEGKPITDILLDNKNVFAEAVDSMQKDNSRSRIIRFLTRLGHSSVLKPKSPKLENIPTLERPTGNAEGDELLSLEAQGIMVYDRTTGEASHTMWMIRPSVVREITIDLPPILVEPLGVGAEILANYLNNLAELGASDPSQHPPPPPILCRICERQITPWWFEKHTELCLQEHKAEMDVQLAHENLMEHRNAIVKVLDALEAQSRQRKSTPEDNLPASPSPEYKGHVIGPVSAPSSNPSSGRASPASPPSRSRDRSTGFGHHRARSFAVRRPVARIVELVLDLCDTALEIETPAIKGTPGQLSGDFQTISAQSESRLSQVLQWQSPSATTLEQDQGLSLLCDDTTKMTRAKVEAIFRHQRVLEYSERLRIEYDQLVRECIDTAMRKAARIAAGEDSESDSASVQEEDAIPEEAIQEVPSEEVIFPGSFEAPSAMAAALRTVADPSIPRFDRRTSSTAASTRSNSPRGCPTPKSNPGPMSILSHSKRASMHFESDAGAESDSSVRSSVLSGSRRADSPSSEISVAKAAGARERKRRSLILPSVLSSRQQSPARNVIQPPSSPLRTTKTRVPSGTEGLQSPITSPTIATSEFSSPAIVAQPHHHHRRQSSATSSDVLRAPPSPRLYPASNPQPRAVPPSVKDFEIIKPISKGAFGSVYLVKKKSTGDYFAMKCLKKADMIAKNQVTNVKAERAIMMWQGESDFVAKLYWTFSSKDYLYLVMEYLNGGDCASLIKILGGLSEDWAKKYMAEIVLGVEHLHSRGIVHRDLKPDNLLIDQKGHLKLTDFGLSRMGLIGRQKRVLTEKPEETAPDLLKQGPFPRSLSLASSRSASFDLQGQGSSYSPSQTPGMTPALAGDIGQPSYFALNREHSREASRTTSAGNRSDSESSDVLQAMFRRFSIAEDLSSQRRSPIEEETGSEDGSSPDPYVLQSVISHTSGHGITPPLSTSTPLSSSMMPPPMALFDPDDKNRRFVGTPDYLAPETIKGLGQDEVSDWWSLGCILFEFLFGYPPFNADTADEVFQKILDRQIQWPDDEDIEVSDEAKDLVNKLICLEPSKRLGANAEDKYASGGEEIKAHPWFSDINWDTLLSDEAQFVPALENAEDTEYFDTRGATMQNFAPELDDQGASSAGTPGADYPDRPHDALSRVRSQVNTSTMKRGLIPLHIPPHVRDGRSRRLSEPVSGDDFGNFAFKNLPVLEKANKDVIQKLRAEAMQAQSKPTSAISSPVISSPVQSFESSPILPMPLKRALSTTKSGGRPASPSILSQASSSPSRASQPGSPLLVNFSTGNHERRKTSGSAALLHQVSSGLQPGSFFDVPRLQHSSSVKAPSSAASPIKLAKSPGPFLPYPQDKQSSSLGLRHGSGSSTSSRARSQTVGSGDGDYLAEIPSHHKRRSQVLDVSPSSSDTEDQRQKALQRVRQRRQSSRRLSQIIMTEGPIYRPLDVLICDDHPVSRYVLEKLLEKLRCRPIAVQTGSEAVRYAMGEVKFDIIMMEFRLPQINGSDVARMIRDTKNPNSHTPLVAVTAYLQELQAPHHFDGLIEKPPTKKKLTEILGRLCQWKPPPENWTPGQPIPVPSLYATFRQESIRTNDSPTSLTSSQSGSRAMPLSSWDGSSREDSITSSIYGDNESVGQDIPTIVSRRPTEDWREDNLTQIMSGLGISEEPLTVVADALPRAQPSAIHVHQGSAPAVLERPLISRQRSKTPVGSKTRPVEQNRPESAESGDDEDEELGDVQVRAKSPKGRARGSSKLGMEMMRTNSHGSVVSVDEIQHSSNAADFLPNSPPPVISEHPGAEDDHHDTSRHEQLTKATMTPPEIFPPLPGGTTQVIDMDATPKSHHPSGYTDPNPTPKAKGSPSR